MYVPWGMLAVPVGIPAKWCDDIVSYFVQLLNCVEDMVGVASVSAAQQIKCWVEMSLARDLKVVKQCSAQAKLILDEAQGMEHRPDQIVQEARDPSEKNGCIQKRSPPRAWRL